MKMQPAEISKVLSVDTRVKIIELLKTKGPMGAKEIGESVGISTAAVSQHLKILKHAGLVTSERKGFWIPYSINEHAMECCRQVLNDVCCCGCETHVEVVRRKRGEMCDLKSLKEYELKLKKELEKVQKKVEELESGE